MKYLGVGLSRTGTTSLAEALTILGFKTAHWEPWRLRDVVIGENHNPNFRRFDDLDAITDLPAALYWREILATYPECKAILTVRDKDSWWRSVSRHYQVAYQGLLGVWKYEAMRAAQLAYGSDYPCEYTWKKRSTEHNNYLIHALDGRKLLVMDIKEGWRPLCRFIGVDVPDVAFPHANAS